MDKLKFEFIVKSNEDPKTNVICITSITDMNNRIFAIPDKFQPVKFHETIMKTETFLKVKTTLQRRHEKRQVWISLTPEIRNVYIDVNGNTQLNGYLLEEITAETETDSYDWNF
ncbi:hypothetical protein HELRODRAFT_165335 [Helobdella robusta]|uniref:Uncharacterized protein n=1 Tax=Helobdella robusta TaxID=6412 RepID=T1EWL8_HELRO|nr:hypothetical protein HELRODRAFT_165335 [Helobdella robusta]ESN91321.1 hypothetical protein HELRODRAFT_165335 [Helobdella robusta]